MLGLNEIKSEENLPPQKIYALCESMVAKIEESEMRRLKHFNEDRYLRTLKTQFKELDDRYPGIFNVILSYGRTTPDGYDTLERIKKMLQMYEIWAETEDEEEKKQVEVVMEYPYAETYVKAAVGAHVFDKAVKPVDESMLPVRKK